MAEASRKRWELEAWLLTDEPIEQIAVRMGLSDELVATYHDLFFDVRGRLGARDWVSNRIFNRKRRSRLSEEDVDFLLKHYAYHAGAVVLEDLLDYYREPPDSSVQPETLDADARAILRGKLMIRASILSVIQPADGPSAIRQISVLKRAILKLHQAEAEAKAARSLGEVLRAKPSPEGSTTAQQCGEKAGSAA